MTLATARPRRPARWALYTGLGLTLLAALAPLIDLSTAGTIADHVREAYPAWDEATVRLDRNAIAIYLAVTGGLGVVFWVVSIIGAGRMWGRIVATIAFASGLLIALMNLSIGGEGYKVIVPTVFGVLTLLPCAAGVFALVAVWRKPS